MARAINPWGALDLYLQQWGREQKGDLIQLVASVIEPTLSYSLRQREVVMPLMRLIAQGPQIDGKEERDTIVDERVEGRGVCCSLNARQREHFIHTVFYPPDNMAPMFKVAIPGVDVTIEEENRRRERIAIEWVKVFFEWDAATGKYTFSKGKRFGEPSFSLSNFLERVVDYPKDAADSFESFCTKFAKMYGLSSALDHPMTPLEIKLNLVKPITRLPYQLKKPSK